MSTCQQAERKQDAHADAVWCLAWLSNTQLLTGSVDGSLKLWQVDNKNGGKIANNNSPMWTSPPGEFQMGVVSICRLQEAKSFAATSMDGRIRIYQLSDDDNEVKLVRHIEAGPVDCWTLCSNAEGTELVSGTSTGAINVWDVATGRLLHTYTSSSSSSQFVLAVARHQDLVAAGCKDGSVFLVNLLTNEVLSSARLHQLPVRALAFSAAGDRLFSASDDGLVSMTTVPFGEKVGQLKGHLAGVLGVAVAVAGGDGGGDLVATCSSDRRVRVWNSETRECQATFEAHGGQAFAVAFSPHRDLLVSCGAAGELQFYTVA